MEFCKQYNAATESQRGHDHPRRDHDLRGPLVHLRPEDAADDRPHPGGGRRREGEQPRRARVCRIDHRRPGGGDRLEEDAGPERQRPRGCQAPGCRHRPLHGHRRQQVTAGSPTSRHATSKGDPQVNKGKRYAEAVKGYDRDRLYSPIEAVELVKSLAKAKFDETVELAVRLGVDPRRADQIVRGSLSLPAGTGRTARVVVFAAGEQAADARAAGADVVGSRRPRAADREGRLPRLRRSHRHARPDGPGRDGSGACSGREA